MRCVCALRICCAAAITTFARTIPNNGIYKFVYGKALNFKFKNVRELSTCFADRATDFRLFCDVYCGGWHTKRMVLTVVVGYMRNETYIFILHVFSMVVASSAVCRCAIAFDIFVGFIAKIANSNIMRQYATPIFTFRCCSFRFEYINFDFECIACSAARGSTTIRVYIQQNIT